jgi:hypothetical protein
MITPVSPSFSPLVILRDVACAVYHFVCKLFRQLKEWVFEIPSLCKTYAIFQTVEWLVPAPLKALANTIHTHVSKFFSNWQHENLLEANKKLKTQLGVLVNQVNELIASRENYLELSKLDQALQQLLKKENSEIQKQADASQTRATHQFTLLVSVIAEVSNLQKQNHMLSEVVSQLHILLKQNGSPTHQEVCV